MVSFDATMRPVMDRAEAKRQVVALLVAMGAIPPNHTGDVRLNLNQGGLTRIETTMIWK